MAIRNDCLLAFTSGSTFCRSRTAGGFGRLRSVGGGGSCRDLIASESTGGIAAPADMALRWITSPFLAAFSESLLPVTKKKTANSARQLSKKYEERPNCTGCSHCMGCGFFTGENLIRHLNASAAGQLEHWTTTHGEIPTSAAILNAGRLCAKIQSSSPSKNVPFC